MAWAEERGGRYRVRYRLPDGSLFTEGGFTTRADAERRATDVESDQRRELFVDPRLAQTTVGEWVGVVHGPRRQPDHLAHLRLAPAQPHPAPLRRDAPARRAADHG